MTKDLSKSIMNKSKTKSKYLNWPSREDLISYKRTKNKCNSLTKKTKRDFLKRGHKRWNYDKQKKFGVLLNLFYQIMTESLTAFEFQLKSRRQNNRTNLCICLGNSLGSLRKLLRQCCFI